MTLRWVPGAQRASTITLREMCALCHNRCVEFETPESWLAKVGARIRELRLAYTEPGQRAPLSQQALANRVGHPREWQNRLEQGRDGASLTDLHALALVLKTSPANLLPPLEVDADSEDGRLQGEAFIEAAAKEIGKQWGERVLRPSAKPIWSAIADLSDEGLDQLVPLVQASHTLDLQRRGLEILYRYTPAGGEVLAKDPRTGRSRVVATHGRKRR